ncbi:g5405 [Coccomyxa elongata]
MGVPKRVPSLNTQVEGKCRELGGINAIHSVLMANNGIAAAKFIRSIRSWAYKTFGNERAVALVAMATPEDMRIDAEHIRMADQFVEVPGGSNNNNYGNVQLIVQAPPAVLGDMERCARALAKSVGYVGAATVEYLYTLDDGKYYFLELNPRLQVEHPVTEWISGVNIPSCQLMIGMGVPLHRIPDIRRLFGKDPKGNAPIDFEADTQIPPSGHVVAVRVTSEDANDGFKPTCGSIDELSFRTSPDVWGYFSVKSGGGIHEFSDSQFGHLFAKGEAAIRAMVVALKEVKIRGEIRTTVDYCVEMIQSPDFVGNNIHTGWLDSRIASHVRAEKPAWYLAVISGALLRTLDFVATRSAEYLGNLEKGQLPPARLTLTAFEESFVLDGLKYTVKVSRRGPQSFRVFLGSSHVDVVARKLNDGGLLVQVDGQSHVVHSEEEALGTRLTIDSLTCLMANETDPSKLLAISPGKLMRYLVPDESHVQPDQPYAEIEVMKMLMPLLTPAAGKINFQLPEGAVLSAGDLLAVLDLDDPGAVTAAAPYLGGFPELGPPLVHSQGVDYRFKEAYSAAKMILEGYEHPVDQVVEDLLSCLDDPALALLQWNEAFGVVQTRLPGELALELEGIATEYEADLMYYQQETLDSDSEPDAEDEIEPLRPLRNFPAVALITAIHSAIENTKPVDHNAMRAQCEPLLAVAEAHAEGKESFARGIATELFSDFLSVEERFAANKEATEQEVIDSLRQVYSTNLGAVVDIVVSHQGVATKTELVSQLMSMLVLPAPEHYRPLLRRLAALGNGCAEVVYRAQQLLEHSLLSELRAIVARALSGLDMFASGQLSELDLLGSDFLETPSPSQAQPMVLTRRPTVVEGLYSGLGSGAALTATQLDIKMKLLVEAPAAVEDALASLLDHHDATLQTRALQTYIKRVYHPFLLRDPEIHSVDGVLCALWVHTHPTLAGMPQAHTSLSVAVIVPALSALPSAIAAVDNIVAGSALAPIPRGTLHVMLTKPGEAGLALSKGAEANRDAAAAAVAGFQEATTGESLISADPLATAAPVNAQLTSAQAELLDAGYESVSVLSKHGGLAPLRIGFWRQKAPGKPPGYIPDALLCAVEPVAAQLLELSRLAAFGEGLTYAPSRNRQCHLYTVTQRRDSRSLALKRVFVRCLVRQLRKPALLAATYKGDAAAIAAAAMEELEATLVDTLTQLERSSPPSKGEVRFTRMTLQLNQQFHDQHPQQYKKKEWKQIRSKEQNLRALCKDVLGKIYGATKAKTITGAATGPSGEILQAGAEDGDGTPVISHEPGRFTHPDQIGPDEIDLGDREWANFAQFWDVFKTDETILCTTTREAGDGRRFKRAGADIDGDLPGDLQDDGQSPAPKKAKKTPAKSRLGRSDHLESKMLNYFQESDKQYRLDAEAERAHLRALEEKRLADKAEERAQTNNVLQGLLTIIAGALGAAPTVQAAVAPQQGPQPPRLFPQAAPQHRPQQPHLVPQVAPQQSPQPPPLVSQTAPQHCPQQPQLVPQAAPQQSPRQPQLIPQAASQRSPQPPQLVPQAASQAPVALASSPGIQRPSEAGSIASAATAAAGCQMQLATGTKRSGTRERRPPTAHKDYAHK